MGGLREDFAALVAAGERTDLARAALAIARIAYPDLDPAPYLRQLDGLAAAVRPRLHPGGSPEAAAAELAGYLFGECGFRGNQEEYYDPRNSYLNDVLESRTGIPITLAVVMIETGARLGLGLEGVGFPGHFLVRVRGLLYEHLECFGAALGDFRRYLELAPEAPDAEQIHERVARLVRIAAAIH